MAQCSTHAGQEAIDGCRRCGGAVCALCGEVGRGEPVCARCRDTEAAAVGPPPPPGLAERPMRSPFQAALLSFVFPGLGQAYVGDYLQALTFASLSVLCFQATFRTPAVAVFLVVFWFYQIVEAYQAALRASPAQAPPEGTAGAGVAPGRSPVSAWVLVGAGGLLLAHTLTGTTFQLSLLVPLLAIAAGLWLLVSYFRGAESSG